MGKAGGGNLYSLQRNGIEQTLCMKRKGFVKFKDQIKETYKKLLKECTEEKGREKRGRKYLSLEVVFIKVINDYKAEEKG